MTTTTTGDPTAAATGAPTAPSPSLTADLAEKLLNADVRNLAAKVARQKKPLSSSERKLLQSVAAGGMGVPTFAKSAVELADILDTTRRSISRWRKEPGNPGVEANGGYNVASWKEFVRLRGHSVDDSGGLSQTNLKAHQILLQNRKLEFQLEVLAESYIPKAVAKRVFSKLILELKARCFSSATRLVTLAKTSPDTPTACVEVQKEMELIWRSMTDSKWFTPTPN